MNKLVVIKERLGRYTNENTNTDEKLENGAISDWTFHSDEDTEWLIGRVEELVEACESALIHVRRLDPQMKLDTATLVEELLEAIVKARGE